NNMDAEWIKSLSTIAGGSYVATELVKQSKGLLSSLFGPSIDEFGGILSDNIKLRRLKNQVKIFKKAEEYLRKNNIDPKSVNLKVLAPLIEYSSLEENEILQNKW